MSLSFLHGGIALLGVAAAAVPIIIHLLLKQKPRPIVFPALQLIRGRHTSTVKRLRLQHLLLLALRVAMFVLLGLALARPTLHSSLFSIDQKAPVAVAVILDSSLSMQYKQRGKTRLEEAKELVSTTLESLPEGSEITVIDSSNPETGIPGDFPAAVSRIRSIELQPARRMLNDAMAYAFRTLAKTQLGRREVYLFTDLAASGWEPDDNGRLLAEVGLIDAGVRVYIINVGVEKPENTTLGEVRLGQQILTEGMPLELEISVQTTGPGVDRIIELTVGDEPRDSKAVRIPAEQAAQLKLTVPGLGAGYHQGKVALNVGDAMPFDDVRYFTVATRPALRTLVVTDDPADAFHWTNALVPESLRRSGEARYQIDEIQSTALATTDVTKYGVITLLNVAALDAAAWTLLDNFVQSGGGLFVALGERVNSPSYDSPQAQAVLPAKLDQEVRVEEGVYLTPEQFSHPVLGKFREWGATDLPELVVNAYWKVTPHPVHSIVIVPYTNGAPGLIERSFGVGKRGRSVMLTTAAHYRPSADTWTELPRGWSYLVLAHQLMQYLSGTADSKLNYLAGQRVVIDLDPANPFALFTVTNPSGTFERLAVNPGEAILAIPETRALGQFRVDAQEGSRVLERGFSVNEPLDESNLTPMAQETLEKLIGEDRLVVARDPESLENVVDEARVGRELFPWLMLLVVAVVVAEGYLSNRFYRSAT